MAGNGRKILKEWIDDNFSIILIVLIVLFGVLPYLITPQAKIDMLPLIREAVNTCVRSEFTELIMSAPGVEGPDVIAEKKGGKK